MASPLVIADVAQLLKTEDPVVEELIAAEKLHGVTKDGVWSTTREILEADLEILTEAARIERLRTGVAPVLPVREEAPVWLTNDWVAASLLRVRAAAREE